MTLNPHDPEIRADENLQWPEADVPIDDAILKMFKRRVLRLLADTMTTPSQMLNAVRRLEVMKEFPLRVEKQARTLAMAEARIELRRRTLELREAQLKENREKRELAMAKEKAKAASKEAAVAKAAAKAKPDTQTVPASTPVENEAAKASSIFITKPGSKEVASSLQTTLEVPSQIQGPQHEISSMVLSQPIQGASRFRGERRC